VKVPLQGKLYALVSKEMLNNVAQVDAASPSNSVAQICRRSWKRMSGRPARCPEGTAPPDAAPTSPLHHLYITEDANPCNTLQAGEEETA
jgi:hypothetical protein